MLHKIIGSWQKSDLDPVDWSQKFAQEGFVCGRNQVVQIIRTDSLPESIMVTSPPAYQQPAES